MQSNYELKIKLPRTLSTLLQRFFVTLEEKLTKCYLLIMPEATRPHRYRPGTKAAIDAARLQRSSKLILKKRPFYNLVKSISYDVLSTMNETQKSLKYSANAVQALAESTEAFLLGYLEDARVAADHRGPKKTLTVADLKLSSNIRGEA